MSVASILLVCVYNWHAPIVDPIRQRLAGRYAVTSMTFAELKGGAEIAATPDLVVVADAGSVSWLRSRFPGAIFLHLGHGLISKNQTQFHYGEPDYICVASEAAAERLSALGHIPRKGFLPTGLVQSDLLFAPDDSVTAVRIAGCTSSVVYAPTFNPSLSSAAMLGTKVIEHIRGEDCEIGVVIKPHPHFAVVGPHWIDHWQEAAVRHRNVLVHPAGEDIVPVLLGADLMVSDASSVVFHFLALNRPIVLVDNPARFDDRRNFDPQGIEWRWRDVGERVTQAEDLAAAVRGGLADPLALSPARLARRAELFGTKTDGGARVRIVEAIDRLLMVA